MKIENAYNRWAASYDQDRNRTRDLDEQITRDILKNHRHNTILELGCGTGKNTAFLAEHGKQVLALDFSQGMINQAIAKVNANHVQFAVADLTKSWPCRDESFELLVCNLVLEHIENLPEVFSEAARVLRANGDFFISELHPYRQYQGVQAHFQRDDVRIDIPAFSHNVSDFTKAAELNGLSLRALREWWHEDDRNQAPRLISFMFQKVGRT